jgi:branched-chain amino acid transport system ATP-binding protein
MPGARILTCEDVTVRFGGHTALDGASIHVDDGEIVGLIGPNGAGKTTLMECISGFRAVHRGAIAYKGRDLLPLDAGARAHMGIGRTLQNVRLFPYLSVLDNIRVALHRHQQGGPGAAMLRLPALRDEEARTKARAEELIDTVGMTSFIEKLASELSYGTLRLIELACMLALEPSLLLLDEPASGVSQKETEALGPLLRGIKKRTGASILLIEHDMPLVMSLCDRIHVLDAGANLAEGTPAQIQANEQVIEAYLGTPLERKRTSAAAHHEQGPAPKGEVLLRFEGVDVHYGRVQVLDAVDLEVRKGERVALLGTNGAGKSTVLKVASGLVAPSAGQVVWKDRDVLSTSAEDIVASGLGHVPGGRGLFPSLTVRENLTMGGWLIGKDKAKMAAAIDRIVEYFPWIPNRLDQRSGTLSGGELQQLACARALLQQPEVLMIDELSLGLAPVVVERLMETVQRLHEEEGLTVVIVEQQATFALGYTDRAYFLEKGAVRYEGDSAGLLERGDLLRSVFLAGAAAGFADEGAA